MAGPGRLRAVAALLPLALACASCQSHPASTAGPGGRGHPPAPAGVRPPAVPSGGIATPIVGPPAPGAPAPPPPPPVVLPAPYTFAVPQGWVVSADSSPAGVHLVLGSPGSPEAIFMDTGPGSTFDPSSAVRRVTVGGETGYVILDGPSRSERPGYTRVVQVLHSGQQYEIRCLGYEGFDPASLLPACDAFTESVAWR